MSGAVHRNQTNGMRSRDGDLTLIHQADIRADAERAISAALEIALERIWKWVQEAPENFTSPVRPGN